MSSVFQIARLVAVFALVCAAAVLTTPKNRVPLALRGVLKILRKDRVLTDAAQDERTQPVSTGRRLVGVLLLLLAFLLALVNKL